MLNPHDVAQLTGERIDQMLRHEYGVGLKIDFPHHTAPVYDAHGNQYRDVDGNPLMLHHIYVEAFNHLATMQMYIDPATTYSQDVAEHTLNLLATDTFIVTNDDYMALELRTKFGPSSQVAPSTVLISSGGFAKHTPDGTGDTAIDIAIRETREELGIEISPDQLIKTHDTAGVEKRLLHYPELTLNGGQTIEGVRPSMCVQYLVQSPLSSKELVNRIQLNWESDGIILVPIEAGIKILGGVKKNARAIFYPSASIKPETINPSVLSLNEIFQNAEQKSITRDDRHGLARLTPFHLTRNDSVINGSQNPYENLLRVARMAQQLG